MSPSRPVQPDEPHRFPPKTVGLPFHSPVPSWRNASVTFSQKLRSVLSCTCHHGWFNVQIHWRSPREMSTPHIEQYGGRNTRVVRQTSCVIIRLHDSLLIQSLDRRNREELSSHVSHELFFRTKSFSFYTCPLQDPYNGRTPAPSPRKQSGRDGSHSTRSCPHLDVHFRDALTESCQKQNAHVQSVFFK